MAAVGTIPKPRGLYKIREAARLVTWADGASVGKQLSKRQLQDWVDKGVGLLRWADISSGKKRVTFRALISLRLIFRLYCQGAPLEVITEDTPRLKRVLEVEWPFASKALWSPNDPGFGKLVPSQSASSRSKGAWEAIYQRLQYVRSSNFHHGLEFDEDGIACAWQPATWVRLEPGMVSGRPCIARTRVPTWIVKDMWEAGDSVEEIAYWYDLAKDRVENAVEWERQLASVVV